MSRPFRGSAQLVGEQQTFNLHLDIEMMVALEKETGMPLGLLMQSLGVGNITLFSKIFWVSAQRHHRGVTIGKITEAMSDAGLEGMMDSIKTLFKEVMPAAEEGDGSAGPPDPGVTPDGTGTDSFPAGAKPASPPTASGGKRRGK